MASNNQSCEFDPVHPRATNRRHEPPWYLKYWPLFLFVATMGGSAVAFYVSMVVVAADVEKIKKDNANYVKLNTMDLRFKVVENTIDYLENTMEVNENRTATQFQQIDEKLDKIHQLMLRSPGNHYGEERK